MPYITLSDLNARYGADEIIKLADRDGDSIPDAEVIAAAIDDAGALIDSYLATRYALPLNPVPSALVRLACSIARYHLYDDKPADKVKDEYQAAALVLEKIAAGQLGLIGGDAASGEGASGAPDNTPGKGHFGNIIGY
jgi:phage gp36-like protein